MDLLTGDSIGQAGDFPMSQKQAVMPQSENQAKNEFLANIAAVSFTVRGLSQMTIKADKIGRGNNVASWGGLKKALNQVVGEKSDFMQLTLETSSVILFASELVPENEITDEVHFARVAHLPSPLILQGSEFMRLVLWSRSKTNANLPGLKRLLVGELSLALRELHSIFDQKLEVYVRRLQSEKFLGSEVLIWPVYMNKLHSISMSTEGMASVKIQKFNPILEIFTFMKNVKLNDEMGEERESDLISFSHSTMNAQVPKMCLPAIVTTQELTVEPKFAVSLPLELLRPLHAMLERASQAWLGRFEMERIRQGYFYSKREAFKQGRVLIKVNLSEAKNLDSIVSYSASGMPTSDAAYSPPTKSPLRTALPSQSSPAFVNNVKKIGGRAITLAKNATQANVRNISTIGYQPEGNIKTFNVFACLFHVTTGAEERRHRTKYIGRTNTEYSVCSPQWNSNRNKSSCPHNQPRTDHQVSGSATIEVNAASEGIDANTVELKDFIEGLDICYYVKALDLQRGYLLIKLYQETYSMRTGIVESEIGQVHILLEGIFINETSELSHTNLQWYPVLSTQGIQTDGAMPLMLVGLCIQNKALDNESSESVNESLENMLPANPLSYNEDQDYEDMEDSDDSEDELQDFRLGARPKTKVSVSSPKPAPFPIRPAISLDNWNVSQCYDWMRYIGRGGDMMDTVTLEEMYQDIEYPLQWCEAHAKAVLHTTNVIHKTIKIYEDMLQNMQTFRGSQEKKNKNLQFLATNLHAQIWSVAESHKPSRHYDFTTTGAPAAHALGFKYGGLVSLEGSLSALKRKVILAWTASDPGPKTSSFDSIDTSVASSEQNLDALARLLMEYERKSLLVSIRRTVVTSQVLSIAACNIATKIEMMAMGTLNRAEELAIKWEKCGYLISFEGLLSVQGKELGMVEDTVAAMSILQTYVLRIETADKPMGLEVNLNTEEHVLLISLGIHTMQRLPLAMQKNRTCNKSYQANIVPVLFTQGIDMAQSVSNQTSAKTKGSFQADINASSFQKLNQYCSKFYDNSLKDSGLPVLETHDHLMKLETAVMSQQNHQKNTSILLESEKAVRLLGGGRVTFCKSGKDRTAMSITLEEGFLLVDEHLDGIGGENRALKVANILRENGARIAVAEKNIGKPQYSFNAIQRQFLPELYRAPLNTIQDVLTSFQKRDS